MQLADEHLGGINPMNDLLQTQLDTGTERVIAYRPSAAELFPPHHSLIQGDTTKRGTLKRDIADLIVTSPPYNLSKAYNGNAASDELSYPEYLRFSRKWLSNCYYWTRPTGRLCVNVSLDKNKNGKQPLSADITTAAIKVGWKYHATVGHIEKPQRDRGLGEGT